MRELGQLGEELRLHVPARDEQIDRFDPRRTCRLDEVLSFDREQPQLVSPAPVVELADELQALVVARGDQTG
jgi:hypothetical protein